jgi:hypothetical protein
VITIACVLAKTFYWENNLRAKFWLTDEKIRIIIIKNKKKIYKSKRVKTHSIEKKIIKATKKK